MEVQDQYRNLHLISYWEIAVTNMALWDIPAALDCWKALHAEATVSFKPFARSHVISHGALVVVESYIRIRHGCLSTRS